MALSDDKSSTPDQDLTLYQLHSRYARLAGLSMEELSRLWHEMKGSYPTRERYIAALSSRLPFPQESFAGLLDPETQIEQAGQEDEGHFAEPPKRTRNKRARHFLVYWRPDQIQNAITKGVLDHAASEQFGRVAPGDVLWITGRGTQEPFITVGPLDVAEIVDQEEAKRRLPYEPWPARYHALSTADAATVTREVSLTPILEDLEFASPTSPRLDRAKPLGRQLQTIRQLTDASAKKLMQWWNSGATASLGEFEEIEKNLDAYEELDQQRVVLVRREQSFLRQYLFGENEMGACAICGNELPVFLLVAAHIKLRAKCSDAERRDYANNVVPMCLLGCDALFERGLIIVEDGKVRVRLHNKIGENLDRFLRQLEGRLTSAWKIGRVHYFNWHAQHAARTY